MAKKQKKSAKAFNQDLLSVNIQFPTAIYEIKKPEFLSAVNKIAEEALVKIREEKTVDELYPVYMTGNLYDHPDILPFQYFVGQTAYNILSEQGYNLDGFETYFSELWCQEHYKHSAMEQHTHGAGSQIIGFYFLDCPEDCSRVVFHDPRAGKPLISWAEKDPSQATFASNMINFKAEPGMLMFTNAWLPHSFTRHGSDKPMRFIHFNVGLRPYIQVGLSDTAAEVI